MLYPLKFEPLLKDKIWGGSKLEKLFDKKAQSDKLGESWELSGIENDESVVTNGFLAGNSLSELIEIYMGELVGDKIFDTYGLSFPLLFKLIDANENLSIQVHPGDEVAAERHNSFGKTEMWVVLDADSDGQLIIGFKDDCSKEEYLEALQSDKVEDLLQHVPVRKGDVFFIPAGLVHAIGKGVVVAEIQESSDITYRIYDYKRVDAQGKERELHTEQTLDVINFAASKDPKTQHEDKLNAINELVSCDYFTTNLIPFDVPLTRNYGTIDSFVVYMCLEGSFVIETETEKTTVCKGETVMIPAMINEIGLIPDEKSQILEVYIK
ncbi:MAG: mannose-6-phosphate isomerase [Paludibacter sp.]|nr:mannose-6-phosphate isomerase [Paludibacter sp.]